MQAARSRCAARSLVPLTTRLPNATRDTGYVRRRSAPADGSATGWRLRYGSCGPEAPGSLLAHAACVVGRAVWLWPLVGAFLLIGQVYPT